MKEAEFKIWLASKYKSSIASTRFSNCLRVEAYEGNLDHHFDTDNGHSLWQKLKYSTADERNNSAKRHIIPIDGHIRRGTATLKQAVKLYFDFRMGVQPTKVSDNEDNSHTSKLKPKNAKTDWPVWSTPTNQDLFEIVKLTARFTKFIHPDIVQAVTEDNNKNWAIWRSNLKLHNIDPNIYLWHKSPSAFPGVRRYVGSKEIAFFRKHTKLESGGIPHALQLDDNDYPKHLWSFVFRGKPFPKHGPKGYSLAHLADHKDYKNRMYDEFSLTDVENSTPIYGLYTAPTNTVFIPNSLIRPSDFSPVIRKVLMERANNLYGNICNMLPPNINLVDNIDSPWHFQNFDWAEPVGNLNNIDKFLQFRNDKIRGFLTKSK